MICWNSLVFLQFWALATEMKKNQAQKPDIKQFRVLAPEIAKTTAEKFDFQARSVQFLATDPHRICRYMGSIWKQLMK